MFVKLLLFIFKIVLFHPLPPLVKTQCWMSSHADDVNLKLPTLIPQTENLASFSIIL